MSYILSPDLLLEVQKNHPEEWKNLCDKYTQSAPHSSSTNSEEIAERLGYIFGSALGEFLDRRMLETLDVE